MSTEQIIMGSALSMTHTQQAFFEQEDYLLPSSQDNKHDFDTNKGRHSGRNLGLDSTSTSTSSTTSNGGGGTSASSASGSSTSGSHEMKKEKQSGSGGGLEGIVEKFKMVGDKLSRLNRKERPIRVGFCSRYFFKHPV
jgi:hypothetical protein